VCVCVCVCVCACACVCVCESRLAQSVERVATGWTTGRSKFEPRQRGKDSSSSLCVQTGSGAHPVTWVIPAMSTGVPFPGTKARPGHEADHSPLSSAEVGND
jgi:hypothetical protein